MMVDRLSLCTGGEKTNELLISRSADDFDFLRFDLLRLDLLRLLYEVCDGK